MLYETGKVVAIDSDGLWLETLKKSACGQCSVKAGCGQQLLAKSALTNMTFIKAFFPKHVPGGLLASNLAEDLSHFKHESNPPVIAESHATLKNQLQEESADSVADVTLTEWNIGDIAEIALDENALVKATVIAYLLPLASMVISTVLAAQVITSDFLVAACALVGLLVGGALVHSHAKGYFSRLLRAIPLMSFLYLRTKAPNGYKESCYHALVVRKV